MTVVPSTIISSETSANEFQLWAMRTFLRLNWRDPVVIRHAYVTSVIEALSNAEQRRSLVEKPTTLISFPMTNFDEFNDLESVAMRIGIAKSLAPIWPDKVSIASGSSSQSSITEGYKVDSTNFFIQRGTGRLARTQRLTTGQKFILWDLMTNDFQVNTIESVAHTEGSGSTYTAEDTLLVFGGRGCIIPLMESRLVLNSSIAFLSDRVAEMEVEFQSSPGNDNADTTLEVRVGKGALVEIPGGAVLDGFQFIDGVPVFDSPIHFGDPVSVSYSRSGQYTQSGVDDIAEVFGTRPRVGLSFTVRAMTRDKAWKHKRLFDWAKGRTFPFWVRSPKRDLDWISGSGTSILFTAHGPAYDWNFRPYISYTSADGIVELREVVSVVRASEVDTVTINEAFTIDPVKVRTIRLMRFASDEIVESWATTEICDFPTSFIEVIEEKVVIIERDGEYDDTIDNDNDDEPDVIPSSWEVRDVTQIGGIA